MKSSKNEKSECIDKNLGVCKMVFMCRNEEMEKLLFYYSQNVGRDSSLIIMASLIILSCSVFSLYNKKHLGISNVII